VFDLSSVNREIGSTILRLQNPNDDFHSFDNDYHGTSNFYDHSVASLNNGLVIYTGFNQFSRTLTLTPSTVNSATASFSIPIGCCRSLVNHLKALTIGNTAFI